eukprot:1021185-Amphidinium_carterae.1
MQLLSRAGRKYATKVAPCQVTSQTVEHVSTASGLSRVRGRHGCNSACLDEITGCAKARLKRWGSA